MSNDYKEPFFSKTFFERLGDPTTTRSVIARPESTDVINSIKYNLSNILNSRAGHAQSAPDLGLMDFNDATITNADVSTQIKSMIETCILTYEPRISGVIIHLGSNQYSPMDLEIHLTCFLNISGVKEEVQIDVLFDKNRKYNILYD